MPRAERHGKAWHLWPVWFAGSAHLATLAAGIVGLALGGGLFWSAVAIIAGCAFGTFFMAFHSAQGPQLGLPQMILSRPQFGHRGALLVWFAALIAFVGYNAFNQLLASQALHRLIPALGIQTHALIVGFGALAVLVALLGYDAIHVAQRWIAYAMLALLTLFSVGLVAGDAIGADALRVQAFAPVPFFAQFFAAASYQLSWSIYVSDYSRYLPADVPVRSTFWWTYLGAFIGGAWMMLLGAFAITLASGLDVAASLEIAANRVLPGLGAPLLVFALIGLLTISALNFYGSSLTLLSAVDSIKPLRPAFRHRLLSLFGAFVVSSAIALLASKNFISSFEDLLAILLYLFTPWTAINLVDFYAVRKGHYSVREIFNPDGMYGRWNWRGLVAYVVGFAAMAPFFSTSMHRGPAAQVLHGVDLSMLVGLPVSALVYIVACRSIDLDADRARAAAADAGIL